ncbi:hypothetical protein CEUSTIGMA_g362.t1 [Chlamydomonas eustigma]|uniref:CSC1/OSCA1-like 7TM region domain-containing protein n=1 Tax=Chlamydomonas eustigma TaxID=1157962 RepID=A0A250WPY9_9CHLO|nr:hypothetical protein CEUSTIGMA_g362.t1 [Chlamydomonas eustigma]|eukprot:GAX72907.1 hypothetical protein CEUSTIGMA_g362.t1 [Chlamydomonas eustigma]
MSSIPPPSSIFIDIFGTSTIISDASLRDAAIFYATLFGAFLLLFCILQSQSILYKFRLVSPSVSCKPPPLPNGVHSLWAWLWATFSVGDAELLSSAGLDALMMVKMQTLGLQLLFPIAVVGGVLLIPVNLSGDVISSAGQQYDSDTTPNLSLNPTQFMRLTMTNIPSGSPLLWVHCICVHGYVIYCCWVLKWHYHQFVVIRQRYMQRGEGLNWWRDLQEDQEMQERAMLLSSENQDVIESSQLSGPGPDIESERRHNNIMDQVQGVVGRGLRGVRSSLVRITHFTQRGTTMGVPNIRNYPIEENKVAEGGRDYDVDAASSVALLSPQALSDLNSDSWVAASPPATGVATAENGNTAPSRSRTASACLDPPSMHLMILPPINNTQATSPVGTDFSTIASSRALPTPHTLIWPSDRDPYFLYSTKSSNSHSSHKSGTEKVGSWSEKGDRGHMDGQVLHSPGGLEVIEQGVNTSTPLPAAGPKGLGVSRNTSISTLSLPSRNTSISSMVPARDSATRTLPLQKQELVSRAPQDDPRARQSQCWELQRLIDLEMGGGKQEDAEQKNGLSKPYRQSQSTFGAADISPPTTLDMQMTQQRFSQDTRFKRGSDKKHAPVCENGAEPDYPYVQGQGEPSAQRSQAASTLVHSYGRQGAADSIGTNVSSVNVRGPCAAPVISPLQASHQAPLSARFEGTSRFQEISIEDAWQEQLNQHENIRTSAVVDETEVELELRGSVWKNVGKQIEREMIVQGTHEPEAMATGRGGGDVGGHQRSLMVDRSTKSATELNHTSTSQSWDVGEIDELPRWWQNITYHYRSAKVNRSSQGNTMGSEGGAGDCHSLFSLPQQLDSLAVLNPSPLLATRSLISGGRVGSHQLRQQHHLQSLHLNTAGPSTRLNLDAKSAYFSREEIGSLRSQGLLSQPSVRFRKTINTQDIEGELVSVHAQHYAILVTDVNQDALRHGEQLWCDDSPQECDSVLSSILSPSLRDWLFHKYVNGSERASLWRSSSVGSQFKEHPTTHQQSFLQVPCAPAGSPSLGFSPHESMAPHKSMSSSHNRLSVSHAAQACKNASGPQPTTHSAAPSKAGGGRDMPIFRELVSDSIRLKSFYSLCAGLRFRPSQLILKEGSRWRLVQQAVADGRVAQLPRCKKYSLVSATFSNLFPDAFDRAIPVIKHKTVDTLLLQLDNIMWKYEQSEELCKSRGGVRPMSREGFCGLFGSKVDLLDLYRKQMLDVQEQIREARKNALKEGSTPSWFVFFKTQHAAACASQALIHGEDNREFRVLPAPGPEEVNWSSLWMNYHSRSIRGWIFKPLLTLFILIPVSMFSAALMQLSSLICPAHQCVDDQTGIITVTIMACPPGSTLGDGTAPLWPYYCDGEGGILTNPLETVLTVWVPAFLVTLWQGSLLPLVTYLLVQATGQHFSLSALDREMSKWIWYYAVVNQLIGGIIGATLASQLFSFRREGVLSFFYVIGNYMPASSNFFLNVIMFRALVYVPMRMVIPHPASRFYIFRRWLCRCTFAPVTQRDKAFLYQPTSPRYGFEVGMLCSSFLIAFIFAAVSPMVTIGCWVFFAFSWIFWRYNCLYVYIRKYESGGMLWTFVFSRILMMLVAMAGFTACVMLVKGAYLQAVLLVICVPLWVWRFQAFSMVRFEKGIESMPLQYAASAPPARVDPRVYIPPPLNKKALGWHPEWTKPCSGWGFPPYSF